MRHINNYITGLELTPKAEMLLAEVRHDWMYNMTQRCKYGVDRTAFRKGINWFYEDVLHLKRPGIIYCNCWGSAFTHILLYKVMKRLKLDLIGSSLQEIIELKLNKQMWSPLGRVIDTYISRSITVTVMERLGDVLRDKFWTNAAETIRDVTVEFLSELPTTTVHEYSRDMDWSNLEHFANCDFLQRIGIFKNEMFEKYKNLIRAGAFGCYMYKKAVFVIQPPLSMEKNAEGLLHSTTTAAAKFRNGSNYYFLNGEQVPDWLIEKPQKITLKKFMNAAPQHRALVYKYLGHERMMEICNAKEVCRVTNKCKVPVSSEMRVLPDGSIAASTIYKDGEEQYILYASDMPDPEVGLLKWVEVTCTSTGSKHLLAVPEDTTDPRDAVAGTFGFNGDDYSLNQTS